MYRLQAWCDDAMIAEWFRNDLKICNVIIETNNARGRRITHWIIIDEGTGERAAVFAGNSKRDTSKDKIFFLARSIHGHLKLVKAESLSKVRLGPEYDIKRVTYLDLLTELPDVCTITPET